MRQPIGFLLTTYHPYLVLSNDVADGMMFNAAEVDITRYQEAQENLLAAEEELLEGIEQELVDICKMKPAVRDRARYMRHQRALQLKNRLSSLRRRHSEV
jgi:hypothetical protein